VLDQKARDEPVAGVYREMRSRDVRRRVPRADQLAVVDQKTGDLEMAFLCCV